MIYASPTYFRIVAGILLTAQSLAAQADHRLPPTSQASPPAVSVLVSIHAPVDQPVDEKHISGTVDGASLQDVQLHPADGQPLGVGMVVDSSGSTAKSPTHRAVVSAALQLLQRLVRPNEDKAFWANFNEEIWIDAQLTDNMDHLREAASKLDARGGTALFDSLKSSCDYLASSKMPRRALILISDGDDTASRFNEKDVAKELPRCGAVLYVVSTAPADALSHESLLRSFVDETGGLFFRPTSEQEIAQALEAVEDDIRHQFLFSFVPTSHDGKAHALQVTSSDPQEAVRGPREIYLPKK